MTDTVTVEVRMPAVTMRELAAIAELAGVTADVVMMIAVAHEVRRLQRQNTK